MQRVDDAFPGLYDRSDCSPPKDTDPLRPPTDWAPDRNPGWPTPGRIFNCGDCSRASRAAPGAASTPKQERSPTMTYPARNWE